jgi:predicted dehydrogenase
MKQVIQNYRTGKLAVADVPAPALQPGGLLVVNHASLISAGTERNSIRLADRSLVGKALERPDLVRKVIAGIRKDGVVDTMKRVFDRMETPIALGYSCAGSVQEVGRDVRHFSVGERVACAGQNYASHAEAVYVPKNLCVKIPDGVDFEEASFVTLGAIALQGVRQADPKLDDRVAVIGLGLLGQLTVQLLKAAGCLVLGADLDPARLQLAKEFGADRVVLPGALEDAARDFTQGRGVDAVLLTAHTSQRENGPIQVAGLIARKRGRVVVVGAVGMSVPREIYYRKELELRLSTSSGPGRYDPEYETKGRDYPYGYVRWTENRNMEAFLGMVQRRAVNVKSLVTHRYPIDQAEEAYQLILNNATPYLGIVIGYRPSPETTPRQVITVNARAKTGTLNLGIVGAGHHVRDMLLPALHPLESVVVRSVCTTNGIEAFNVAGKVGAAYCTTDFREVLKDESIHAVLIGTRHDSHGALVVEALNAGKHVFVEKPLCLTEEELAQIAAVYEEKAKEGTHLMVGFNRRFSPHADKVREWFRTRSNPLVMSYRVNAGPLPPDHWAQDPEIGGGRIVGEVCHFVDFMQAVCGAPPTSVAARRIARHGSGCTDDQSLFALTFADGSIGAVVYTAGGDSALPKERFEAFGDGRSAVIDDFSVTELYGGGARSTFKSWKRDKGFQVEMGAFVTPLLAGGAPAVPFEQIERVTRTCLLAMKSLQDGYTYELS